MGFRKTLSVYGVLILETTSTSETTLQPVPTSDSRQPLNCSTLRKHFNFFQVCFFTLIAFTSACLNNSYALSVADPFYLTVSALVVVCEASQAWMKSIVQVYGSMFTIIQMTVADLYIVHQRGTYYNGIYMFVVEVGNFLVLVPSGYITLNLSWRMVYIIVVIIAGVQFVMTLLFFEKTNHRVSVAELSELGEVQFLDTVKLETSGTDFEIQTNNSLLTGSFGLLALITYTSGSWVEFSRKLITPFKTLVTYPIVTFCAPQYGFLLSRLSMAATISGNSFVQPPYNFSAEAIDNVNIAPCVGMILGCLFEGWFHDMAIIWLSKNQGVHEPEFKLYSLMKSNFSMAIGILLFGISTAHAFGFGSSWAIVVTHLLDCYEKKVPTPSLGSLWSVTLWLLQSFLSRDKIGIQNVYISAKCFTLIPLFLTVPVIHLRRMSESRYLMESVRD
ncbi:hypothetical protein B0I74DRAFT_156912 [Yarrowia lipolytica]|nr:hypothetical protein B0I74DRAFT_156912 [Yarrowia lipolytica]